MIVRATTLLLVAVALAGCASTGQRLAGTKWRLDDLSGAGVLQRYEVTLEFPDSTRVAGNASCNEYFGPLQIDGTQLRIGELGSTRKSCEADAMTQERDYLEMLRDATHYHIAAPYLTIDVRSRSRPLRFSRISG